MLSCAGSWRATDRTSGVAIGEIARVMARERRSPYLPGTRSSLWLFVERAAVASDPVDTAESEDDAVADDDRRGAVLALIRRLPLED
jgi:hypothetical protein